MPGDRNVNGHDRTDRVELVPGEAKAALDHASKLPCVTHAARVGVMVGDQQSWPGAPVGAADLVHAPALVEHEHHFQSGG